MPVTLCSTVHKKVHFKKHVIITMIINYYLYRWAGADYGLGTIGTCLGPPPAGGPPSDQKNENPMITVKKSIENDKNGDIVGFIILFVIYN